MEHEEEILFKAERKIMRRYPSRAVAIQRHTVALLHERATSCAYSAYSMSKAINVQYSELLPVYEEAERNTLMVIEATRRAESRLLQQRIALGVTVLILLMGLLVAGAARAAQIVEAYTCGDHSVTFTPLGDLQMDGQLYKFKGADRYTPGNLSNMFGEAPHRVGLVVDESNGNAVLMVEPAPYKASAPIDCHPTKFTQVQE